MSLDIDIEKLHRLQVPDTSLKPIAFFAHERGDARVTKRIAALQDQGREVIGFTFHRVRDKADVPPTWENIHLGTTYNRRYFQRLWVFAKCIGLLWRHRDRLGDCGLIYVVNTDNAMLALLGRMFVGRKIPLVLELADIQPAMVGSRLVSRILRLTERFVLGRTALLVTTSPGFVREYFLPVQKHTGEVFLLENKVYPSRSLPVLSLRDDGPTSDARPWVLGCFGALRCARSLRLMHFLAENLGDRIKIVLRGYPAGTIAGDFETLLGNLANFQFGGAYRYPDELAEMYDNVDFNWAFDESDPNGNSAWLLPNRIYEGGCFGVPALGSKLTETGRWIASKRLGWTFEEPLEESLLMFFKSLDLATWDEVRCACLAHERTEFTGEADYLRLSQRLIKLEKRL